MAAPILSAPLHDLIQSAFVAELDHLVDEDLLLRVVQAREQRFGGIGDAALVGGAIDQELGLVAHLLDDVVGRVALGAGDAQVEPLGAVMPEIVHSAGEAEPVLLLVRRQVQLGLDALDIGVAVGDALVGRELRRAVLGHHGDVLALLRRVLGCSGRILGGLGRLGGFGLGALCIVLGGACLVGARLLRVLGGILLGIIGGLALVGIADPQPGGEHADDAADGAAQNAADRTGRLVAGGRAVLDAL